MIRKILIIGFAAILLLSLCGITSACIDINLPQGPVTLRVTHPGSNSYFNSQLKNVPDGYDINNGTFVGWCGDKDQTIKTNHDYTNTNLYSIYNSSMPSYLWHNNWSKVNYLLNHKIPNVNWWQVQYAAWYLLDFGDDGLNNAGWSMVENASLYGDDYCPTYFDTIGIIADPGQNVQLHFFEFRLVDPNGDLDGDGIKNIDEDLNLDGNPNNDDTDSDGYANYNDPDDDGDGVNTSIEDVNGNGNFTDDDTDSDGTPNYLDSDDDGDGIPTTTEITDGNTHGQDVDSDGIPNYLDTDSDGDEKSDFDEGVGDSDGDGIPNYLDPNDEDGPNGDLDGEGLLNYVEDNIGTNKTNPDSDGDSLNDYIETNGGSPIDSDGDGIIDANDPDDDDDGILTITEVTDGNQFGQDVDSDGIPNHLDLDSDGDGLLDEDEGVGDSDGDGIPNYLDFDDLQSPSKVENLTVTDAFNGNLSLKWNNATDNVGVHHYEIFRNNTFLTNVTKNKFNDTGLIIGVEYNYTVRAVDAAGNKGPFSDEVSGISTDSIAPSKVENLTAVDAKDGKIDLSWDAATDNVGVHHYEIFRDNVLIKNTTSLTFTDNGRTINQEYSYKVRAVDAAGNKGPFSDLANQTSTETNPPSPPSPPGPTNPPKTTSSPPPKINKPPHADANGPYSGFEKENIIFNGSKSYDHDDYITSWIWDFGDGNTAEGEIVEHNYSEKGEYTVILTVTDMKGDNDSDETSALINEPNSPPGVPVIDGPSKGFININYTFSIITTDENDDDIRYEIEWADGSKSESTFIKSGKSFNMSHLWKMPGNYTINISADDGEEKTKTKFIIEIGEPEKSKNAEGNNFILIFLAIIAFLFFLLFFILAKKDKKDDEENNK